MLCASERDSTKHQRRRPTKRQPPIAGFRWARPRANTTRPGPSERSEQGNRPGLARLVPPYLVTLPALMHEVQTFSRREVPPTFVCTTWMFGFQRREVRRCEKETLLPKFGPLPQMSQTEATGSLQLCGRRSRVAAQG